jgi:hypothetical protein
VQLNLDILGNQDARLAIIPALSRPAPALRPSARALCAGAEFLGELAIGEPIPVHFGARAFPARDRALLWLRKG